MIAYGLFCCTWCTVTNPSVITIAVCNTRILMILHSIKKWNLTSVEYNYANKHSAVIKVVRQRNVLLHICRSNVDTNPGKLLHTKLCGGK